jgi:hypothetical protein
MAKKCVNCGDVMSPLYGRDGSVFFICENTPLEIIRSKGAMPYGMIYCKSEIQGKLPHTMINPKESADLYAQFLALNESFKELIGDSDLKLEDLRSATHNTTNDIKLLESANLAIMLGLKPSELDDLFECAMKLGHSLGITTQHAIESLCKGIGRRSYLILDNIGINLRSTQAYDWYKKEHNYEQLNDTQKRIAWQAYAIKLVEEKAGKLGINEKLIEREKLKTRIENFKTQFYNKGSGRQ